MFVYIYIYECLSSEGVCWVQTQCESVPLWEDSRKSLNCKTGHWVLGTIYIYKSGTTMSEYQALVHFNAQAVNLEMVHFLAATAASVISTTDTDVRNGGGSAVSLVDFIKTLISHSNVQTPTLMATTVYLIKLRSILPTDVTGISTTRHRIFIGCLILAAKNLNDSSPLNKHWTKYTDGLFTLEDINAIERELLALFGWNLNFSTQDLTRALSHFLVPIQHQLSARSAAHKQELMAKQNSASMLLFNAPVSGYTKQHLVNVEAHSRSSSHMSIPSLSSSNTLSTIESTSTMSSVPTGTYSSSSSSAPSSAGSSSSLSSSAGSNTYQYSKHTRLKVINEEPLEKPPSKRKFGLTKPIILSSKSYTDLKALPAVAVTNSRSVSSKSGWTSIFN